MLLSECQSVFNQLLLYLSVNKDQVFTGLTILAHNDPTYKGPKEIKTNNQMVRFSMAYIVINYKGVRISNNHKAVHIAVVLQRMGL